jgi:hypothetical protein
MEAVEEVLMETVVAVALLVVVGAIVRTWVLRTRRTPAAVRTREDVVRRLVDARATTADGVTADLHVDFALHVPRGTLDEVLDRAVEDAVEAATRRAIRAARVDTLPDSGDHPTWLEGLDLLGARIGDAVVTAAEVWVTPELRRLVSASRSGGSPPWT